MREFDTGATRDDSIQKLDYEGFNCPLVDKRYAQYMHKHRVQADGGLRASDNWQKGIPPDEYLKSACRHFMDWRLLHRGYAAGADIESALCGVLFNVKGYLHEILKGGEMGGEDEG